MELKQIIISDVSELENRIIPKYQNIAGKSLSSLELDETLSSIQEQEDNICKAVHIIGTQLRDEVARQKIESEDNNKKIKSLATKNEKELNEVIKCSKIILGSNDAKSILNYQSRIGNYRCGPKDTVSFGQIFQPNPIRHNQLKELFGFLKNRCNNSLKIMLNPVVVSTIRSPYGSVSNLWAIICEESKTIWTSGKDREIHQIDECGSILKTFSTRSSDHAFVLSLTRNRKLLFALQWPDKKIYKYSGFEATTFLDLSQWCPRGLCHTANYDFLVSMRSVDKSKSRVVRYSEKTETRVIERDRKGTRLFSDGVTDILLLTENGNGDICVSDFAGESVVVVDASGDLRFKYLGKTSEQSKYTSFTPSDIVTDVGHRIIISDYSNDTIHVIDCDGNFVCYIEYPCNGGLRVDADHNLVVGEEKSGKIRVIKYLE